MLQIIVIPHIMFPSGQIDGNEIAVDNIQFTVDTTPPTLILTHIIQTIFLLEMKQYLSQLLLTNQLEVHQYLI